MEKTITTLEDDVLRIKIVRRNGEDTGNYLEFDLTDIELPIKLQNLIKANEKNKSELYSKIALIDKKEDVPGDILSRNESEKIKVLKAFYEKEKEVYDMFLGENGVDKLLDGRKLNWLTFMEIDKIIEEQIIPNLDVKFENIMDKIKSKYSKKDTEEIEVLD